MSEKRWNTIAIRILVRNANYKSRQQFITWSNYYYLMSFGLRAAHGGGVVKLVYFPFAIKNGSDYRALR